MTDERTAMISDILFQAIDDIRRFQKDMPETYDNLKPQIDALLRQMDRLREYMDTPPFRAADGINWEALVRIHLALLENPFTPESRKEEVRWDLLRLARIADGQEELVVNFSDRKFMKEAVEFPARPAKATSPGPQPEWVELISRHEAEIERRAIAAYHRRCGADAPSPTRDRTEVFAKDGKVFVSLENVNEYLATYRVFPRADGSFRLAWIEPDIPPMLAEDETPSIGFYVIDPQSKDGPTGS
jgi:hypothetical protein